MSYTIIHLLFYLQISSNGAIVFSKKSQAASYQHYDWSSDSVPPSVDFPFIAPYYHQGHAIDSFKYTGHIRYQMLEQSSLNELGSYCRSLVVGSPNFQPDFGMVITWANVTSTSYLTTGNCDGTVSNPCPVSL